MSSQDRRLDKVAEHFNPVLNEELVNRAIAALEADLTVDQVDGVPIWEIHQWLDREIARLEKEEQR